MAQGPYRDDVSLEDVEDQQRRRSLSDVSTVSSTSAVLEQINELKGHTNGFANGHDKLPLMHDKEEDDANYDTEKLCSTQGVGPSKATKRVLWIMCGVALGGWLLALFLFLKNGTMTHISDVDYAHDESGDKAGSKTSTGSGTGKVITLESTFNGEWAPYLHSIQWIKSPDGKDGMVLEQNGGDGRGALVVEDVRSRKDGNGSEGRITLVQDSGFVVDGDFIMAEAYWPSADLKRVLVMSERQKVFRHSFTGIYWIWNVKEQKAEPLDPDMPKGRVQLAQWSPKSDRIAFTRDNNLFIRDIYGAGKVTQITKDGGENFFYGIPDWVYEEEVFADRVGTWWSNDGEHLAFVQTNETEVPEYPVQYFISRPSGSSPAAGEENYPDEYLIKYPKAGAPNPTVHLKFYSVEDKEVFEVEVDSDFDIDDRLITEVVWGEGGRVIVRNTNRESDTLKTILINVRDKSGKVIRELDYAGLDGGWFEVSHDTHFVPSDPSKGRAHAGYIDTVVHGGFDHLAYFTPLDNPEPIYLTSGEWEVVSAPSAVDLENNIVYFLATKQGPATRHVYSVKLDGSDFKPLSGFEDEKDAFWDVSFSAGAGFALMTSEGPGIPTQQIVSTAGNKQTFSLWIESNDALRKKAAAYNMPERTYTTVHSEGVDIPVLELKPPHFDSRKKYPVVLAPYNGPQSQSVQKRFNIDFQVYMASALGFIVLVADGRGTGFKGRAYRRVVRGNLGAYEAADQIAVAKEWSSKSFVDADRIAIWGWSFGGFLTLKTLETDAHNVFSYGAAVAPVTDWRFYDSVYTERYMHTPQHNPAGYDNSTITNMTALTQNVRFLLMHGTGDDNVHFQNSLRLLDRLDQQGATNYDFHAFPDSDHNIVFHNAHIVVYQKLSEWLVNAFNGEWLRIEDPVPMTGVDFDKREESYTYPEFGSQ